MMATETSLMHMVFAFEDQSPSFTNGFEIGMLWQQIEGEGRIVIDCGFEDGLPLHAENLETVRRMAAARNYKLETKPPQDGWVAVRLTYASKPKPVFSVVGQEPKP